MTLNKVENIINWAAPRNVKQVPRFTGFTNF